MARLLATAPLVHVQAAVDIDVFASDETGAIATQKANHGGDLMWLAQSCQGRLRYGVGSAALDQIGGHRRLDDPWRDRIDASARCKLPSQRPGETNQGALGRAVMRVIESPSMRSQ